MLEKETLKSTFARTHMLKALSMAHTGGLDRDVTRRFLTGTCLAEANSSTSSLRLIIRRSGHYGEIYSSMKKPPPHPTSWPRIAL